MATSKQVKVIVLCLVVVVLLAAAVEAAGGKDKGAATLAPASPSGLGFVSGSATLQVAGSTKGTVTGSATVVCEGLYPGVACWVYIDDNKGPVTLIGGTADASGKITLSGSWTSGKSLPTLVRVWESYQAVEFEALRGPVAWGK